MEVYETEEQQVEAIKNWWKENGKAVIFGAVVGLGGLFGWRYYQSSVIEAQELASDSYTKAIESLAAQGLDASDNVQSFIDSNTDTSYAVLAALQLAKAFVDNAQLDEAISQLNWAQEQNQDPALAAVIQYRLARLHAEQTNYDLAFAELDKITDESWAGRLAELRGDIQLQQGDKDAAFDSYTQAQLASDASQLLQMKLDDLAR